MGCMSDPDLQFYCVLLFLGCKFSHTHTPLSFSLARLRKLTWLLSWNLRMPHSPKISTVFLKHNENYFTSSDPHPTDELICHNFWPIIWKSIGIYLLRFYPGILSDIISWHSIWHLFWHSILAFYLAFFLAFFLAFYLTLYSRILSGIYSDI